MELSVPLIVVKIGIIRESRDASTGRITKNEQACFPKA